MASISFSLIFGQPVTVVNDKSKYVEVVSPLTSKTHKYNMATELRQHHKNCLFAIFYGGGAKRMYAVLSEYINAFVPPDKIDAVSKEIASKLKAMMPQLLVWLQKSIQEYEENGYVVTSRLGRRVKFGQNAYGDILNSKIQGTGAESIKLAMKKQWEYLREKEVKLGLPYLYLGHIALNVHDQCVLNIKEEYVEQFKPDLDKLASDCLLAFLPLIQPLKIVAKGNIITKWEK
jgi:DNA polymerase I-like protein with 3'-5' exonuclease and polymerase domains